MITIPPQLHIRNNSIINYDNIHDNYTTISTNLLKTSCECQNVTISRWVPAGSSEISGQSFEDNFRTFKVSKRRKSLRFMFHKSVTNIQKEPNVTITKAMLHKKP